LSRPKASARSASVACSNALKAWCAPIPNAARKKLPLGVLIAHLNDARHLTRERIAAWVADADVPQDESHADH